MYIFNLFNILIKYLLILIPLVFINLKHGVNLIIFITFIGSLCYYLIDYKSKINNIKLSFEHKMTILVLASPVLAIGISQYFRQNFYPNNWDAPIRMLLCIPIFVAISHGWLIKKNKESIIEAWLKWTIPCSLLISLVTRIYFPATNWGNYKTTYFVDPLTFCSYTLLFTFLSIIGLLSFYKKNIFLYKYLIITAIITGFYLSSSSGARTGWLNFPFFIFFL